MTKIILGLAAIPMFIAFVPVAAQTNYNGHNSNQTNYSNRGDTNLSARIDQLGVRLQAGVQDGSITRRDAATIRNQIRQLERLERRYAVNGFSGQERSDLQQRIRVIRQQLRVADNGANGRYAHWDAEDGYSQGSQQPYQQGYDSRYPAGQGSILGVLNQVFGGGSLQVGQRATGNLYGVPAQYQRQYRDGQGVYYRSDGRRIYQIDARSQTVTRIFQM